MRANTRFPQSWRSLLSDAPASEILQHLKDQSDRLFLCLALELGFTTSSKPLVPPRRSDMNRRDLGCCPCRLTGYRHAGVVECPLRLVAEDAMLILKKPVAGGMLDLSCFVLGCCYARQ